MAGEKTAEPLLVRINGSLVLCCLVLVRPRVWRIPQQGCRFTTIIPILILRRKIPKRIDINKSNISLRDSGVRQRKYQIPSQNQSRESERRSKVASTARSRTQIGSPVRSRKISQAGPPVEIRTRQRLSSLRTL